MKNRHNQRGFTLAEMLIVVAIIGVLAGVSFVAVQTHQESLNQVELDTVAKEIFVAAQNHLSMAWNEGYLGLTEADYGTLGTMGATDGKLDEYFDKTTAPEGGTSASRGVYYFSVEDGSVDEEIQNIHNLILPPYALDGTVAGGNYLIRYQPSTGLVLDVFYASRTGNYARNLPGGADGYTELMNMRWEENKNNRRSKHIGWYGGTEAASLPQGEALEAPVLEVVNGDVLKAIITDAKENKDIEHKIALLVTGKISQAQQVFRLEEKDNERISGTGPYEVVLDDITTANMHFAEIGTANDADFIPGEDIVLRAVAYNDSALSNIANSDEKIVNSLFEKADNAKIDDPNNLKDKPCVPVKAYINNIRHLENLSYEVSKVDYSPVSSKVIAAGGTEPVTMIVEAEQTTDLEWGKTGSIFTTGTKIYKIDETGNSEPRCFLPVNKPAIYTVGSGENSADVPSSISYDGKHHSIKGITVKVAGSAGLFGDLPNDSSVKDLALIDFSVTSVSGSAGALAGTLTQSGELTAGTANVSNVVAYNTGKAATETITSAGDVGGLIGTVTGGEKDGSALPCTALIEKSAAALVVKSTGANKGAGGLIGKIDGGTVTGCYSGGHTVDKKNGSTVTGVVYSDTTYNVTGAATVGGLIGDAGTTAISYSYSTCSVIGNKAGGLVGNAGGAINTCYSTGLVSGIGTSPVTGAFAVLAAGASATNCKYYEIINELATVKRGTDVLTVQMAKVETGDVIQSIQYMVPAIMSDGTAAGSGISISAIDESANSYNAFVGDPNETPGWKAALPYDMTLANYYQIGSAAKYNLRTVSGLISMKLDAGPTPPVVKVKSETTVGDYVDTHYGDWPAPEIFVINTAS